MHSLDAVCFHCGLLLPKSYPQFNMKNWSLLVRVQWITSEYTSVWIVGLRKTITLYLFCTVSFLIISLVRALLQSVKADKNEKMTLDLDKTISLIKEGICSADLAALLAVAHY